MEPPALIVVPAVATGGASADTDTPTEREIARLCKEVTASMLGEMNPDIPALVDAGLKCIQDYQIEVRALKQGDFSAPLEHLVPDTSVAEEHRYADWGKSLGEGKHI